MAEPPGRLGGQEYPVQPGEGIYLGPVVFSPSAQLQTTFDDNVYKVDTGYDPDGAGPIPVEEAQGDFLNIGQARLAFKLPISHSYLSLVWTPTYRAYSHTPTPQKDSNLLTFDSLFRFSSGAKLGVRNDYSSGFYESRRYTADYALVLTSTPFRRNDAVVDYEMFLTPSSGIGGSYVYNYFNADQTLTPGLRTAVGGTEPDRGRYFDYFDYSANTLALRGFVDRARYRLYATGSLARTVQDRTNVKQSQLQANGCLGPNPPEDPDGIATCELIRSQVDFETIRQVQATVGIQGEVLRSTRADVKVGYADWQFLEGDLSPYKGPLVTGTLEHRFNDRSAAFLDVERVPVQTTGQYRGYYIRRGVALGFGQVFGPSLQGRLRVLYNVLDFPGSDQPLPPNASDNLRESVNAFTVHDIEPILELLYRAQRGNGQGPLMLRLAYNPMFSSSDLPGLDIRANRVTFSLQYGWF